MKNAVRVAQCRKNFRENFACFSDANEPIQNIEFKLTDDIRKLILETKYNQSLTNEGSSNMQSSVTNAELINFTNKLSKEIACFTFSNNHSLKQIVKIQKWITLNDDYQKNFSLKSYEVSPNLNFDKMQKIAECNLTSQFHRQ